jgi:hypothetical protein
VLLARFHPFADDSQIVVVGRVICLGTEAWLDPVSLAGLFATPASMILKLRYLIERSAPAPFERLQTLRSQFWSFIDVTDLGETPDA